MSALENPLTPLSRDLDALLEELEAEERSLSRQRRILHDRIDLSVDDTYRDEFREQEREVSERRRELHVRIDALRSERAALVARPQLGLV